MLDAIKQLSINHELLNKIHASAMGYSSDNVLKLVKEWVAYQHESPETPQLLPRFAQFMISAFALYDAQNEGDLSKMGDWIGWSLSESINDGHTQTLHIGRLIDFHESPSLTSWSGFKPTMIVFFASFYYYARERTAMKEIGEELWTLSFKTFEWVMDQPAEAIEPPEIFLGVSMLCWAGKESPSHAREFAPYIERIVINTRFPEKVRAMFCLSLATSAGQYSSMPSSEWAERTLAEFDNYLVGEQRVQMMATLFCSKDVISDAEPILAEMEAVQSNNKAILGGIEFLRDASLRGGAVQPYFLRCMEAANVELVLQGLQSWYQTGHPDNEGVLQPVLVTLPFGEHSYLAVLDGRKTELFRDPQVVLERLVRLTNDFIGAASTVAYADNSALTEPERPGVPNYQQQTDLPEYLCEAYCPLDLEFDTEPACQVVLHSDCHPVQATQLMAWGNTWPISVSLSNPYPDRKPLAVAIWSGAGSMTEAMEIELVKHIFQKCGATVDVYDWAECSLDDFLRVYQDTKYDVLWVISHGEFNHWYPKDIKLQIARDRTSASLRDLWEKSPSAKQRRLLVLNVCDGARVEERGLLKKVGLAAGLAGPEQATISHLWPVMGFPSATFGVYLAHFLSDSRPFFESYLDALRAIRKSAVEIADELSDYYGDRFDLIQRLKNRDEDYSPIQIFGSAAFYQ